MAQLPHNEPRSTMSGQPIGLAARVTGAWGLYRAHRRNLFSNAEGAIRHHGNVLDWLRRYTPVEPAQARVLDLGCGQQASQTLLFHMDGARVTGIDSEVPTFRMGPGVFGSSWKRNGPERAVKSLARHVLFDRAYFKGLASAYGRKLPLSEVDVRIMDATAMTFEDDTFDFIYSMAVFEHIEDIAGAAREVARVLKPTGVAVIVPHLFPCLSGGHHLEWARPDAAPSTRVPPWDHLREWRFPANVYLNRLCRADYDRVFGESLRVEEAVEEREGEALLTQELARELGDAGYSRDDLTTKTVTYFLRKP